MGFLQKINTHFNVSTGYQYLVTGDKDHIAMIKAGKVYTRDASGYSRLLLLSDYAGLPNNNTHKAQLKINYYHYMMVIKLL